MGSFHCPETEFALKRYLAHGYDDINDRRCYTIECCTWSGSPNGKSSGNTVNGIIIFGVAQPDVLACAFIDIEIPTVDDVRKRLPAKTCILACESCNYSHGYVRLPSIAYSCPHSPFHANGILREFSRLHLSSHGSRSSACSMDVHVLGARRFMSTAHLKQLIYFYMVHIISQFTILFVSVNDDSEGTMAMRLGVCVCERIWL